MDLKTLVRKQIFAENYYAARLCYFCWFFIKSFGKQCVLIYQMGKVGSKSVEASLLATRLNLPVFHIHYLSAEMLEKETDCFYDEKCGNNRKLKGVFSRQLFESYFIRSAVLTRPHPKKKWKIITLVREPIARNISALFHDLDEYIPGYHNNMYSIPHEKLYQAFLEKVDHELPLIWFDMELKPLFGIDVYSSPFPKEKGYQTYSSEQADVLLIRMENLSNVFSEAVSVFLGVENIELVYENQAKDKAYSRLYQKFRERVTLPGDYIEKMYCSKFARHFYSEEEIQKFTSKWFCGYSSN